MHGQTSLGTQAWRAVPGQTSPSPVLLHPKVGPIPAACAGPPTRSVAVLGGVQSQQEHPSPSPAAATGLGKYPVYVPWGDSWVGLHGDGWDAVGDQQQLRHGVG